MRRVLVLGPGGSGKSTLARRLGGRLGVPVIHMDAEFWLPGWRRPSVAGWERHVDELVSREAWVMDGAHRDSLERALARADLAVLLDPAPPVLIWRLLRRRWSRHRRPDVRVPERLTGAFLLETWTYRRRIKPGVVSATRESGVPLVTLRTRGDVDGWIEGVRG